VMDLDPAAVEAAAKARYDSAYPDTITITSWEAMPDYNKDVYRKHAMTVLTAAYPIIAASVERATADAIADKIEAIHHEGMPARNHAMKLAANIARSHGSQTQTTEDGQ
jgi:hypothetical protein